MLLLIAVLSAVLAFTLVQRLIRPRKPNTLLAVVLGDCGHSPRTLAHCTAAKSHGFDAFMLGYQHSSVHESAKNVPLIGITPYPKSLQEKLPSLLNFLLKAIFNSIVLAYTVCFKAFFTKYDTVILQNPPAIPTILVLAVLKHVCGFRFIIDWHNYGYTIMQANHAKPRLVSICERYEFLCGKFADFNFTVTKAMKRDLCKRGFKDCRITTLYDKPGPQFRTAEGGHKVLARNGINPERPVLITSTSWTKDEDFGLLYEALRIYDGQVSSVGLTMVITGKGPEKEFYKRKIEAEKWENVEFVMPWLEAEDYPLVLASAFMGISLHASSSNLDLPMKVVDMLGAGTPVLALGYDCIDELVREGRTGEIFYDAHELANKISFHITNRSSIRTKYQESIDNYRSEKNSWECEWETKVVQQLFQ